MTKRVESLRAPCLDASSTLATSTKRRIFVRLFCFGGSVGQSVASRATCLRSVDVCSANICLCQMIVFENKFSAIILQRQQSTIASTALRSPLDCCARSIPFGLGQSVAVWQSCLRFAR